MARLKAPQRREQLIHVATKLFAKHGFEATTTAAIAEAAGVSEPILYRHFKGKQDLFVAIVRSVSARTIRHWEEMGAGADSAENLIRLIAAEFPSHMAKLADEYHVIHGALSNSHDRKVRAVLKEHYAQSQAFFLRLIEDGQRAGLFRRDMDAHAAAWQLIMTGIGWAMLALNLPDVDPDIGHDSIDTILRGLRA